MTTKIEIGDIVETAKGARFRGRVIGLYRDYEDDTPGAVVQADVSIYSKTKHVYPLSQLRVVFKGTSKSEPVLAREAKRGDNVVITNTIYTAYQTLQHSYEMLQDDYKDCNAERQRCKDELEKAKKEIEKLTLELANARSWHGLEVQSLKDEILRRNVKLQNISDVLKQGT